MANQYVNHVIIDGTTKIDLRADTVTPASLMQGYTAHDASGAAITGTADTVTGSVYQDGDGYLVVDDDESSAPQGTLSITVNGTYDVTDYASATVEVSTGGGGYSHASDGYTHVWFETMRDATEVGLYVTGTGLIDWGDGSQQSSYGAGTLTHTYQDAGVYEAVITGNNFGAQTNAGYKYLPYISAIDFPSTGGSYGSYMLGDLYGVKWVYWPDDTLSTRPVSYINGLFQRDYGLQYARIDSKLTEIPEMMFQYCQSLSSVNIPSGLTAIDGQAFQYCRALTSITIPSSVTSIGNYAFQYCSSLTEYHILPTTPPTLGTNAFYAKSGTKMYVPAASLSAYQSATNWSTYASYMVGE